MIKFPLGRIEGCTNPDRPELRHVWLDAVNEKAAATDRFVAVVVGVRVAVPADLAPTFVSAETLRIARELSRYEVAETCRECGEAHEPETLTLNAGKPTFHVAHGQLGIGHVQFVEPEPELPYQDFDLPKQIEEIKELAGCDFDDPPLLVIDVNRLRQVADALCDPASRFQNVKLWWRGGGNPILVRALDPQSEVDYGLIMPLAPGGKPGKRDLLRNLQVAACEGDMDEIRRLLGVSTQEVPADSGSERPGGVEA